MSILTNQPDPVRAGSSDWKRYLKSAIRDLDELVSALNLSPREGVGAKASGQFPVFVPQPFLSRMKPGDWDDPLLRQVLPVSDEDDVPAGFSLDPLNESSATLQPGLLQKYQGRVLLVTTGACAIHCRYCFRRHYPYSKTPTGAVNWEPAINQISADESIEEVILSGGDPLTLVDDTLTALVQMIEPIEHVKRLRIHTRLPIMIPDRVTTELVAMLGKSRLHPIVVIHSNHENELDDEVGSSLRLLHQAGVTLLNQTVLLRGINNDVDSLVGLSKRLLELRVLPYYLHQLDEVIGTAHFEVPRNEGIELVEALRGQLPGYAVPRYVKELPGEPSKTIWA